MLDFLPGEDLMPWRLVAADVIVGLAVATAAYLASGPLAVRGLASRRLFRAAAAVSCAAAIVLGGRHAYGPPIRLALTAPVDRPAQRFADRVARAPEIRAWYARRTAALRASGEDADMIPRDLAYERSELLRNGLARLSDAQLKQRTDLLARALARADGTWACTSILTGDEGAVPRLLAHVDRAAADAWFQLLLDAMLADIRGAPAPRRVTDEQRASLLAELKPPPRGLVVAGPRYPPTESGSNLMRARCDRERGLAATVSAWSGPHRALADLLLATADSYLTGDFDDGASTEP